MCGISGYIANRASVVERESLRLMSDTLRHRGPDAYGEFSDSYAGMSHNRLSLLDLSENGNQPFVSDRYALIYNGEIYNWKEIKKQLPRKKYESQTDTEVLFHALESWGIDRTLTAIKGMFAFAWYDKAKRTMILARDRIGIKPLFMAGDNHGTYWFASELKAFQKVIPCKPDPVKILFSVFGTLEKSRLETAWLNINHISPGTYVKISDGRVQVTEYYSISSTVKEDEYRRLERLSVRDVVSELDYLFDRSVEAMLMSDAPMGAYVSGGIDSSLIAWYASKHNQNLKFFTANVLGKYSEFDDARRLSSTLNKMLFDYKFEKEMALRDWAKVTWHYESPIVVHFNAIPFSNVSGLARKEEVKAVLTGEGSDELFLGYPRLLTRRYDWLITSPLNAIRNLYRKAPGLSSYVSTESGSQGVLSLFEQASQNFTRQLNRERGIQAYDFLPKSKRKEEYLTAQMMQEGIVALLWRNDRMGMIHSIEARFPFLDEDIIAFAMNLPSKFKIGSTVRFHNYKHPFLIDKYIVRRLAEGKLPDSLVNKTKNGFPTYGLRHVKINHRYFRNGYLAELLNLNDKQIEYMCMNFSAYHVALLGSVEIWCKLFLMGNGIDEVSEGIRSHFAIA